jgi:VWFA-related protein
LALVCASSGIASGQQPEASFHADVDLVLLHVAVIDPRGGEVPPLTVEDFTVYDDGTKQEIELFVTPTDAPLDVALVLDSSNSMRPVEAAARRAAITFLNKMALDDCIYVLPFSDTSGPGRWGRSGDPELRGFIGSIRAAGGTALNDAVLEALAQLERANANELVELANRAQEGTADEEGPRPERTTTQQENTEGSVAGSRSPQRAPDIVLPPRRTSLLSQVNDAIRNLDLDTPLPVRGCGEPLPEGAATTAANARRKALILLSDGADTKSKAGFYDALGAARAASVPVFPVAMGYANDARALKDELAELARATGGRLIESTGQGELGDAYADVVALLRSYYLIGYDPGALSTGEGTAVGGSPRWHDVGVELRRPNFEPLVRPGYYR